MFRGFCCFVVAALFGFVLGFFVVVVVVFCCLFGFFC